LFETGPEVATIEMDINKSNSEELERELATFVSRPDTR
jgi:hypothetical protein